MQWYRFVLFLLLMGLLSACGDTGSSLTTTTPLAVSATQQVQKFNATASSQEQVQKAFIAYYGRPADPSGLSYWATQLDAAGGNWSAIIESFGNSSEATALLAGLTNEQKIDKLYTQMFGRSADSGGRTYYATGLSNGSFTLASLAVNIINGASGSDATTVANKLAAAQLFTAGLTSANTAYYNEASLSVVRTFLAGVTSAAATQVSVSSALASMIAAVNVTVSVSDNLSGKTLTSSLLGVNAGPTPQGDSTNVDVTAQYRAIGVALVRTHDLYGPLDMSVMYPDRTKSPTLSSSYNFTSSDKAFDAIIAGGFEPYFRIGDSWDNVTPPTSETERANWAAAATYIVGHYRSRGTFNYVEIWNEPDFITQFWPSPRTRPEFFDLYVRTAKAIKTSYPDLKVGGPAFTQAVFSTTSGKEYLNAFLVYLKSNAAPLDFLSWHAYSNTPTDYSDGAAYIRQQLDAGGFASTENIISEFNTSDQGKTAQEIQSLRLGGQGAAIITGSWIALAKGGINKTFLYRGNDTSMNLPTFYGLLYADGAYKRNAHAFSLWSRMVSYPAVLQTTSSTTGTLDLSKFDILAGRNSNGMKALLIANRAASAGAVTLSGLNPPLKIRAVSNDSTSLQESSQTGMVVTVPGYSVLLITGDGL